MSRPERLLRASALAAAVWLCADRVPAADVPQIEYSAPAACPDSSLIEREIMARLPRSALATAGEFRFRLAIEQAGASYSGTVEMLAPRAGGSVRRVEHPDCRELARALAFIVAVLIDPRSEHGAGASATASFEPAEDSPADGANSPRQTAGAPPAATEPPRPRAGGPAAAPETGRTSPISVQARTGIGLATALTPTLAVMPRFGAGVRYDDGAAFGGSFDIALAFGQSGTLRQGGPAAEISWTLIRSQACLLTRAAERILLEGCGALELGRIRGVGTFERSATWIAPGVLGRSSWQALGPLELAVELGLFVPAIQPHFYFEQDGARRTVHRVPGLNAVAGLSSAVRFP